MSKVFTHAALLIGVLAYALASEAWGAEMKDPNRPQEAQAIKETRAAIEQGKSGNPEELRKHAETALQISEAAQAMKSEDHIKEGIKHLRMAVEMGKKGDTKQATAHAEEALKSLEKPEHQ